MYVTEWTLRQAQSIHLMDSDVGWWTEYSAIQTSSCDAHPVHSSLQYNCILYKGWVWPMGCTLYTKHLLASLWQSPITNLKNYVYQAVKNAYPCTLSSMQWLFYCRFIRISHFCHFSPATILRSKCYIYKYSHACFIYTSSSSYSCLLLFVCFTIVCNLMS